ncbi:hypothetical protein MCOR27_006618 [Pyricularia oryzae]|nr:hypothetical protein MCOR19_009502 [Pyricularia oryzae]KAI6276128.1 hypothetical protein MCOR27_006618 [Pyricularia oryzae]KAI6371430.1 hypothetical protein MCOR32_006206 [Pyricularia oryzae]KAI6422179.1 hypothetical protein MCOR21_008869 [Pyricularia oryzae]KAI6443005.1 hypothetical protein MCOR22_005560 [Pyricularia oryzae]
MTENTIPASMAGRIASYSITPPSAPDIEIAQAEHRITLINRWGIGPGHRVLEIGCGQGNTTAVLAEAVGETGSVDAVDPAPPDYGAPFTLAQAQAHISASAVGDRVTWHNADPVAFLRSSSGSATATWDVAVLAHSVWYFASSAVLAETLRALRGRAARLCVAEYALRASEAAAAPHVLAAVARGVLECQSAESTANIRSPLSPDAIAAIAAGAGWTVERQGMVVPGPGLLDGHWEAGSVASQSFVREVEDAVRDEGMRLVLASARYAVVAAVEALKGERVRTMDVWVSSFT